jgi:hypothetical protein
MFISPTTITLRHKSVDYESHVCARHLSQALGHGQIPGVVHYWELQTHRDSMGKCLDELRRHMLRSYKVDVVALCSRDRTNCQPSVSPNKDTEWTGLK